MWRVDQGTMNENRLKRLDEAMARRGVDAVALVPGANLFYLTGLQMHTSERITLALFPRGRKGYLLVPNLEVPRVESRLQVPLQLVAWGDAEGTANAWAKLKREVNLAGSTVALEFLNTRLIEFSEVQAFAPGMKLADASELMAELRMAKDASEIESMRRASRVIEASLQEILQLVKPGIKEKELATQWQLSMSRCGADVIPDEPIVAGGPNSALPHTTATDRSIERGDMLILDGWCQVEGYFTDITRTVAVGQAPPDLKRIYEVVARANEAGRRRVAPGVSCQEVDRSARQVVNGAGQGALFVHRTGHGLGLEVHEAPSIVEGNTLPLARGMTFTVEPGVYLAGQGGVRIEDDVLVTQDGGESLTGFTRELLVL